MESKGERAKISEKGYHIKAIVGWKRTKSILEYQKIEIICVGNIILIEL